MMEKLSTCILSLVGKTVQINDLVASFLVFSSSVGLFLLYIELKPRYKRCRYVKQKLFLLSIMALNKIHKLIQGLREKKPFNDSTFKLAQDAKFADNEGDGTPKQTQYPQEKSIIHCPASMVLLFILCLEALAITAMEGCIIYYHTLVFAHCNLSLRTLGLSQVDLIYHGMLIMAFVYQVFLYMDSLRQRNVFQLMTLLLYGK